MPMSLRQSPCSIQLRHVTRQSLHVGDIICREPTTMRKIFFKESEGGKNAQANEAELCVQTKKKSKASRKENVV